MASTRYLNMNENAPPSEDAKLGTLLRAARPDYRLPPGFREAVWRRIEAGERATGSVSLAGWLEYLTQIVLQPRVALTAVSVLVLAGVLAGGYMGVSGARQAAQQRYLAAVAPYHF